MKRRTFLAGSLAATLASRRAVAQAAGDFFRGRTLTCYIGYASGGGYDFYARMITRFMPKYIPGHPTILAINMPGESSLTLGNNLARAAPDGTVFGAVSSSLVFDPLFNGDRSRAAFKGPDLTMIGNADTSAAVLIALTKSGVMSIEELKKDKVLVIGASTPTGNTYLLALALKNTLGLKLKIISGYPGTREAAAALEDGEIQGRVWDMEGIKAAHPNWLRDGSIRVLAQLTPHKNRLVPADVPLATDFAANEDDKKVLDVILQTASLARPYIAPPGVPPARVRILRDAFMATMRDEEFLAEMKKAQVDVDPLSGANMERFVKDTYALPAPQVARMRAALTMR